MRKGIADMHDYPIEQSKENLSGPSSQGEREFRLKDIIDAPSVQSILDDFSRITHIPVGIVDLEGNSVVVSGWQSICEKYHRTHPETLKNCIESDTILTKGILPGSFKLYRCKNNLCDMATPLIVSGTHLGNIFIGQFFLDDEIIDYDLFIDQARRFGFDEQEYLSALKQVPRLNREVVNTTMSFFTKFAQILSLLTYQNTQLERTLKEHYELLGIMEKSNEKQKAMIANIADVITIINKEGVAEYISPNIEKWFGWHPKDILGSSAWSRIHPHDLKGIQFEFSQLMRTQGVTKTIEFRYMCKDGTYKDIELSATNLQDDSNINGVLLNYHDITERKQKERDIYYLNYHDVLTGVYNRAFLEKEIKRLDNARQLPLSVIIGDINGLKLINDAFGHAEGDRCLVAIAKLMSNCCRKDDILARTGGDEFRILLPRTSGPDAQEICNRVRLACEKYESRTEKSTYYTSISLGYATKTSESESFIKTMLIAEEFMYKR